MILKSVWPRTVFLWAALALLFSALPAVSAPRFHALDRFSDATPSAGSRLTALPLQRGALRLVFDLSGLWFDEEETEAGTFTRVDLTGGAGGGLPGEPRLPVYRRRVAVPWGGAVRVTARRDHPLVFDLGAPLVPAQPGRGKCAPEGPTVLCQKAYERVHGAEEPVRVVREGVARGVRYVLLEISPTVYDPVVGRLTVHRRVEIEVGVPLPDLARTRLELARVSPGMRAALAERLVGLEISADRRGREMVTVSGVEESLSLFPPHYVLVVADHAGQSFEPVLQPLIDWRRRKGFAVTVLRTSEVGAGREELRAALGALYHEPAEGWGRPTYAVLVGDVTHIPTWDRSSRGGRSGAPGLSATDMYYATMYSSPSDYASDQVADFHLGRLSVNTADELAVVVRKTLAYELPGAPSDDWFNRALLIASDDHGALARHTHEWVAEGFEAEGMLLTNAFIDLLGAEEALALTEYSLIRGQNIVNYSGHGGHNSWHCVEVGAGFVYSLPETGAHPFVIINACQSGQFHLSSRGDCFSETWLKAPGGAVASFAASDNTYWSEDDLLEKALWAAFFPRLRERDDDPFMADYPWPTEERYTGIGAITDMGRLVFQERADRSWEVDYTVEVYNLMGDPSVKLWSGAPRRVELQHPGVVLPGQELLALEVRAEAAPVEGALVALHKDETTVIGRTSSDGHVMLSLEEVVAPGLLEIVVTGHNLLPHFAEIPVVAPAGAHPATIARRWVDDGRFESHGDGNGRPSPGEIMALKTTVKNFGGEVATEVQLILESDDHCVAIPRAEVTLGALEPGEERAPPNPFLVEILPCDNDHQVEFLLRLVAAQGESEERLHFIVGNAISGAVMVESDNRPVEARLSWSGPRSGVLPRTEGGQFSLHGLEPGDYEFVARHPDYTPESRWVTIPRSMTEEVEFLLGRPEKRVAPTALAASSAPEDAPLALTFSIANDGDRPLEFKVAASHPYGDDAYGYRFVDSPDGLEFSWVDLPPDERISLPLGDDQDIEVELPWPFPFYGDEFTTVRVGSNGYLNFGGSRPLAPTRSVVNLPARAYPRGLLAVLYRDLDPSSGGQVYWGTTARGETVFTWQNVPQYQVEGDGPRHTFQCVLSRSGEILYNYLETSGLSIIGLQNLAATSGMNVRTKAGNELSVAIATPLEGIAVTPSTGVVMAGGEQTIDLEIDPRKILPGEREIKVRVLSDSPTQAVAQVSLDLSIAPWRCADIHCDDDNPCTDNHCDPYYGCVFEPHEGACDDLDPCTETACRDGVCVVIEEIALCCHGDEDCAPPEVCLAAARRCVALGCAQCDEINHCDHPDFDCLALTSGSYCARVCERDEDCEPGERCSWSGDAAGHCLPLEGDCVCVAEVEARCSSGALVWYDSCGVPGDVLNDCDGRGCAHGACCPPGTVEEDGRCIVVPDPAGDVLGADITPDSKNPRPKSEEPVGSESGGCSAGGAGNPWSLIPVMIGFAWGLVTRSVRRGSGSGSEWSHESRSRVAPGE